jgi:ABC-type glycerol-3-phosphate transport system permease component
VKQRQASVTVGTFFAYYGVLALVTAGALVPTLWVILSSLKTGAQIYSSSNPIPQPPTLQGYIDAFSEIHLQDHAGRIRRKRPRGR